MDREKYGGSVNRLENLLPFELSNNDYPAVIIYPHCTSSWLGLAGNIKSLISYSVENYNVDKDKVALTGFSLGGSGAWEIGLQYPTLFSCVVPVCGYSSKSATVYPDCPVWIIGSTGDGSSVHSKNMAKYLENAGKEVKLDIQSSSHVVMYRNAYTDTLINWMIEQKRSD